MIPVCVLTGFLGSGKTTLLARLLRSPQFSRTAVIINEFGEVGLDHDLIETSEESFVELQTGCLCCAVRGDLVLTLEDILRRRDAGTVAPFERVVIETSGLADPAPILHALMSDAGLSERLALAGVVATVDAVNGLATLARQPESVKQVAVADRLILTKTDLLEGESDGLATRLAALNPSATLLEASFGAVDPPHDLCLETLLVSLQTFDGAPDFALQEGTDGGSASIFQHHQIVRDFLARADDFVQLYQRFRRRRPGFGRQRLAEHGQHPCIDLIRLGQLSDGLRVKARSQRIDLCDTQARCTQDAVCKPVVLRRRLDHNESDLVLCQLTLQLFEPFGRVSDSQFAANGMEIDVEAVFTDVDPHVDSFGALSEQLLALHAGLAPLHLFRTGGRADGPSSSTVRAKGDTVPSA
jgi:G3E family GTPase